MPLADQLICPVCRSTWPAGKRVCAKDQAALMPNLVGRRIAGRLVTDVLGMGHTSAVYRVRHVGLGREEVLRILRDEVEQDRLVKVLPLLGQLRGPHVVRLLDLVPPEGTRATELDHPMLFTELVDGRSLALRPPGTQLSPVGAARIIMQVAQALAEAHALGIAHGDLKPSNIFLVETPEGVSVRVTDFGLLPLVDAVPELAELRPGDRPLYGSPAWLAPERIVRDDPPDARSDIYALGLIFYELLGGENPMRRGGAGGVLKRQVELALPPVSGRRPLPGELVELVQRMTSRPAELRPASMAEVIKALEALDFATLDGPPGRRTMTGRHVEVANQYAEAYTEVVGEREDLRSEIETQRTRATLAERRSQRWRGLAVVGFALATACLIIAVFALLQVRNPHEPRVTARGAASPSEAPATSLPTEAPPTEAPPTEAPPTEAPPTEAPPTEAPPTEAPPAPPTEAPAAPPSIVTWPEPPRPPLLPLVRIARSATGGTLFAARTEVTRATWLAYMSGDGPTDERPITRIEFWEAIEFLNKLSDKEGLKRCYECKAAGCIDATRVAVCDGYRLPTSLEWEEIARFAYPQGVPARAVYTSSRLDEAEPICSKGEVAGLCDVYGNVWEWTWDGTTDKRLRLGGSWMHKRDEASMKVHHSVTKRAPYLGIRPVRTADPAPIEFAGLRIEPLGRMIAGEGRAPTPLSAAATAVLFDGLRAKGGVVALTDLAERTGLPLADLRAGANTLGSLLDELGPTLRLEISGADGVRLNVRSP